ncbi:protein kinase [Kitasatospora sp. YST-16]|uniref:serine/threonine-protein kinase n=1 Tax=Kitasatospora sp. YST-16 TaxID=2998080 RepID=UPI00228343E2|nr:serine/threonine-protein kinase [Kitasatospora sp. YST-16]WAL73397.1 protein kinase [Kitasatospora sp. YST-16]
MELLTADDPSAIGDYRLLRRLGAGGMGRVYLGRTAGGRTVAVKVVRPELADDPEFRARFRQEVSAARRVGGRWTAPVLDADTEGPRPWVATGYVAGPALGEAVRTAGPLPVRSVHALGARLAEALEQVHALGLVHRDVKPSNVLLTLDGPRLIDFGVARALDAASTYTHSGYVVGSPGFMSPEQAAGSPTGPAGDVFSLGALLAYAATGTAPFGEGVSAPVLLYRVLREEPELGGLEGELLDTVTACLAKDPARRPTPAALRARLAPAAADGPEGWLPGPLAAAVGRAAVELLDLEGDSGPTGTAPVDRQPTVLDGGPRRAPRPEPVPGPGRRRRTLWAVLVAVAVLAAGYGGLAAGGHLPWNRADPGSSPSPGQDAVTGPRAPAPPRAAAAPRGRAERRARAAVRARARVRAGAWVRARADRARRCPTPSSAPSGATSPPRSSRWRPPSPSPSPPAGSARRSAAPATPPNSAAPSAGACSPCSPSPTPKCCSRNARTATTAPAPASPRSSATPCSAPAACTWRSAGPRSAATPRATWPSSRRPGQAAGGTGRGLRRPGNVLA